MLSAWPSASANAPQLGYLSSGFLASPRAITSSTAGDRSGRCGVTGGGGWDICAHSTASGERCRNGIDAVSMVNATQASAYWSVSKRAGWPEICSGAANPAVPTNSPVMVRPAAEEIEIGMLDFAVAPSESASVIATMKVPPFVGDPVTASVEVFSPSSGPNNSSSRNLATSSSP